MGLGDVSRDDWAVPDLLFLFIRYLPVISIVEMRSLVEEVDAEGGK
jgi:hypothetical protein